MPLKKAIYLIGGGPLGLRTFDWARQLGLAVILTDYSDSAPGIKYADEYRQLSAADDPALHIDFADSCVGKYAICGVYCGNEIGSNTSNRLKQHLGLAFVPRDVCNTLVDKNKMKSIWADCAIQSPQAIAVKSEFELGPILQSLNQSSIIKPSFGSGSRGVQLVITTDNAKFTWANCMAPVDYRGVALIEPYIEGRSIDANGVFFNNVFYPAGTLEKYITDPPYCLPLAGNDPARLSPSATTGVYDLLESACRVLGLTEGPVKGDFILKDDGTLHVLEVAPRLHGDVTTCNTLPFGSGINPLKFMFDCWLNDAAKPGLLQGPDNAQVGIWRVLCLPPGADYARHVIGTPLPAGITNIWLNRKHTHTTTSYANTTQIPGYICGYAKTLAQAESKLAAACEKLVGEISVLPPANAWYRALRHSLDNIDLLPKSCGYLVSTE
jgi:biotin carboxylase